MSRAEEQVSPCVAIFGNAWLDSGRCSTMMIGPMKERTMGFG